MNIMSVLRKGVVLLAGIPIIIIGVILIPLPGPGLLVMLLGFFILSLEFEWARKHMDTIRGKIKEVADKAKATRNRRNNDHDEGK